MKQLIGAMPLLLKMAGLLMQEDPTKNAGQIAKDLDDAFAFKGFLETIDRGIFFLVALAAGAAIDLARGKGAGSLADAVAAHAASSTRLPAVPTAPTDEQQVQLAELGPGVLASLLSRFPGGSYDELLAQADAEASDDPPSVSPGD